MPINVTVFKKSKDQELYPTRIALAFSGDYLVITGPNMMNFINDEDVQGAFYIREPDRDGFFTNSLFGKLYANFGMVKKSLMEKIGYWSEEYSHYGADPDASLKFWQSGVMVAATPDAKIIHLCINDEHRKEHLRDAAGTRLQEKWRGIFYFP